MSPKLSLSVLGRGLIREHNGKHLCGWTMDRSRGFKIIHHFIKYDALLLIELNSSAASPIVVKTNFVSFKLQTETNLKNNI